jgi:hypothetical protein
MRRHVPEAAVLTAGLMITAVAGPALATAAINAPAVTAAITTPPAGRAPQQAATAAATTEPASRPVFLITGEQISTGTAGPAGVTVTTGGPGQATGSAGPLQTLRQDGTTQVMPVTAAPYLDRTLSPTLFEPTALARAESAGRLPVRISYSAGLPALPGVTITSSGDGTATGYLTAAGARTFGSALARQYTADHTRASYGQDGIFHGVDISLAGTPAPAPAARPAYPMHTLIIKGTDLAGHPDNGDLIAVDNVDAASRLGFGAPGVFYHGTARFSVPAGHYYALATFCCGHGFSAVHIVAVPQFTVGTGATTTLHVSERSATSRIAFTTPRPAVVQDEEFTLYRVAADGSGFVDNYGNGGSNDLALWVSPTTARPTAGTLQTETQATLTSPSSARGTPYAYRLDFPGPPGIVPAQHFSPSTASLATVHERYYQDAKSSGYWCTLGGYVFPDGLFTGSCRYLPLSLPQAQTQYLSAGPSVTWATNYSWAEGGQNDYFRVYRAGQQLTQDWGAYPLHPQPYVQPLHGFVAEDFSIQPSAFRIGNTLTLNMTPFSDNVPGHTGTGYTGGRKAGVTGSYAIYQNGVRIAHGNPARQVSPVRVTGRPSLIRFTLTARRDRPQTRLSVASSTTWTWHTRRQPTATVPPAWWCGRYPSRRCAVQPMITLNYHVRGLALNGTTAAGRQVIGLDAGHIQLGGQARITRVTARVSVTGGRSWRPATVTALGRGQFRITFTARPGSYVTLRTSATDTAGNSVTETIQNAYQIASHPANGAAR